MKKKLLVTALSTGLALGASLQGAQAGESLLFPFYQQGNGIFTFLMLHDIFGNGTPPVAGFSGAQSLHYIWNFDDLSTPAKECNHEDADGILTPFDLIQQTVVRPDLPGGLDLPAIFGDKSTPAYSLVSPARGFLIVRSIAPGADPAHEADFRGQAIIIDTTNGTVSAYKGFNNPTSTNENVWNNQVVSHPSYDMTWYPTTESGSSLGAVGVDTSWFVIVTGIGLADPAGWKGTITLNNGWISGVRDRDENPRSGQVPKTITCFDFIKRADFMSSAQVAQTVNGGYAWEIAQLDCDGSTTPGCSISPVPPTNATGMLMSKIETTTALGSTMTAISQENAFPNIPY